MDPPDLFPYKPPQMRKVFEAFAAMLDAPCASDCRSARRDHDVAAMKPTSKSALVRARRSIRKIGTEIRAQGHRMLDDMIDYVANIRERPVWRRSRTRCVRGFAQSFREEPTELGEVYREIHRFHRALCDRQCSSRLHGMGAWRRHRRRHAGGDAGGRTQRQSRRPRSHADRGRAPDRRMDALDVRLSRRSASGIFVTGTSMANLMAVLVARTARARNSLSGSAASAKTARC